MKKLINAPSTFVFLILCLYQGKPGWISYLGENEIVFEMNFERGDLTVGYLRFIII